MITFTKNHMHLPKVNFSTFERDIGSKIIFTNKNDHQIEIYQVREQHLRKD